MSELDDTCLDNSQEGCQEEAKQTQRPSFQISRDHAINLVSKLIQLGHFHEDSEPKSEDSSKADVDTSEGNSQNAQIKKHQGSLLGRHVQDRNCGLVFPNSQVYCMTRDCLRKKLKEELFQSSGRLSLESMAHTVNIPIKHMEEAASDLVHGGYEDESSSAPATTTKRNTRKIHYLQRELILDSYLDEICRNEVSSLLDSNNGIVSISDLARDTFRMPLTSTDCAIRERIGEPRDDENDTDNYNFYGKNVEFITGDNGGKKLVTEEYQNRKRMQVQEYLADATIPIMICDLSEEIEWDRTLTLNHVISFCEGKKIPGELHNDPATHAQKTAVFIPQVFSDKQEKLVSEFFSSNGYVMIQSCSKYNMSQNKLVDHLLASNTRAVRLCDSIIHPDIIVSQAAIEDSINSKPFLDLSMHLPEELFEKSTEDDLRSIFKYILDDVDLVPNKNDESFLVVADGDALYFSNSMVKYIEDNLLPSLIEVHAKVCAERISKECETPQNHSGGGNSRRESTKSRSKGKKASRSKESNTTDKTKLSKDEKKRNKKKSTSDVEILGEEFDRSLFEFVSLNTVVTSIMDHYPDLKDFISDEIGEYNWLDDGEGNILYKFCRACCYNTKNQDFCFNATRAELKKILSMRKGATLSNKQAAAKVRSIESSFEDQLCFATSCYFVQALAKLPQSLSTWDDVNPEYVSKLQDNFLNGCAADFAKRITQFCLFRNNIEDGLFHFNPKGDGDTAPAHNNTYYSPVDVTRRQFPKVYLSYISSEKREIQDPLKMLRSSLPGNVGVELARMWILCGGDNYSGGTRILESGSEVTKDGKFDQFLSHIQESCLSMCGLPFKLLDKKSDKNLMFTRRKELRRQLECAVVPMEVLELTVMLLFHQVRGICIAGSELVHTVLELLMKDKKIPHGVAEKLLEASSLIQKQDDFPNDLLEFVRNCGLSRDVTKIDVC